MTGGEAAAEVPAVRRGAAVALLGAVRSEFGRKVVQTFGVRLAVMAVGTVGSVLIARLLGVSGRGLYAVAGTVTGLGIQFANVGLHTANTYWVARDRQRLPALVGNSLAVSALSGVVLGAAAWALASLRPGLLPVEGTLLALAVLGVPLGLANLLLKNLLLGVNDVPWYNRVELANTILLVAGVAALFAAGAARVELVFGASLAAAAACVALSLLRLASVAGAPPALDLPALGPMLGYGFRAYVAALLSFLVLRIDLLMVQEILGARQAGLYSVAVNMAELVYVLPTIVGTLLFPRLAATECGAQRWAQTRRAAGRVLLATAALGAVSLPLAGPAIRLLYGADFLPAVTPFLWLLPAVLLLSVSTVLNNYLAAEGMPWVVVAAPAAGTALNLVLNRELLPRLGVAGASIASVAAYALILALLAAHVRRGLPARAGPPTAGG